MEAENGKEFDPAPSKQVPQAFAFSFLFLNLNPSVPSVASVAKMSFLFLAKQFQNSAFLPGFASRLLPSVFAAMSENLRRRSFRDRRGL